MSAVGCSASIQRVNRFETKVILAFSDLEKHDVSMGKSSKHKGHGFTWQQIARGTKSKPGTQELFLLVIQDPTVQAEAGNSAEASVEPTCHDIGLYENLGT